MKTDVLVIGSGGREHAFAWKLKQSPRVGKIYVAPGNAGTRLVAENVPIGVMEFEKLAQFAAEKKIGLTVVGPDDPLAGGIVDLFRAKGLRVFGPTKDAAQMESSKTFSKQLMQKAKIPTAKFQVFTSYQAAFSYVQVQGAPIVVKASGLALGKGVYVCETLEEAAAALRELMVDKVHKEAGDEVVIEEFLEGPEVSIHALTGGISYLLFPPAQDHKRILDGDEGKNTGGMGVIAPVPWVTEEMMTRVEYDVVQPTFNALRSSGVDFTGLLYPGLKVTVDGPKVLEYNVRFGDPECQVYMRLLKTDILDLLEASVDHRVDEIKKSVEWEHGFAVNIVLASGGYPDAYQKGFPITGIEEAEQIESVVVFHAGTVFDGVLKTNGGRVLGVSAVAATLKQALDRAYEAIGKIHFEGMQYRKDIGVKSF